ncbi:MAG: flagellar M-ring protein FliF [Pigmentiphaga sp.]|nr:flagellar M-ring protein FliF [Pigmentiphaga sp.]
MNTAARGTSAIPASLAPLIDRIRALPRLTLIVGAALAVALVAAALLWSRDPGYQVLFTNLNERDGGAIIAALTQMNVPYQFQAGSGALMVPAARVHETRLSLAAQGLPRGGSVGFELLDESQFGASQFTEQVNYQRALEGELARSIESIQAVESARVHLAIPRQSLFVRDRQPPTASVLVHLYPGRVLDPAQVAAIAHLVSASVPDLAVPNISIVDQYGRLLSTQDADGRGMDASQLRQVRDIEQVYAQRIEAILTPLVGPGNARAQVAAELDFTRREETSETYRPNQLPGQAAVRSQQIHLSRQTGTELPQGIPGALSNQPPLDPVAPILDPDTPPAEGLDGANAAAAELAAAGLGTALRDSEARRDSTTNYEVDRTITHLQHAVGTVRRLSVGVVINHLPNAEGDLQPLNDADLLQLRELVQQAMGYSAARGDTLNLVNQPFAGSAKPKVAWWQEPQAVTLGQTAINGLVLLLVLLIAWLAVLRPMRQRRAVQAEAIAARQRAEVEAATREVEIAQKARRQSRYDDNLETARTLALKDPRAVAAVLRGWMEGKHG